MRERKHIHKAKPSQPSNGDAKYMPRKRHFSPQRSDAKERERDEHWTRLIVLSATESVRAATKNNQTRLARECRMSTTANWKPIHGSFAALLCFYTGTMARTACSTNRKASHRAWKVSYLIFMVSVLWKKVCAPVYQFARHARAEKVYDNGFIWKLNQMHLNGVWKLLSCGEVCNADETCVWVRQRKHWLSCTSIWWVIIAGFQSIKSLCKNRWPFYCTCQPDLFIIFPAPAVCVYCWKDWETCEFWNSKPSRIVYTEYGFLIGIVASTKLELTFCNI
jgi:hypothetical protein